MDELDLMYMNSRPGGKTVIKTPRLDIRELVRKDAYRLIMLLKDVPGEAGEAFGPELAELISPQSCPDQDGSKAAGNERFGTYVPAESNAAGKDSCKAERRTDESNEELITKAGALIAGDMTDQYRFFGYGLWGVFLSEGGEDRMIGLIGLKNGSDSGIGELGYCIEPDYRRKGYAFEGCSAVIGYAAECGFTAVEARTSSSNQPSVGLLKKLGNSCALRIHVILN